MDIRYASSPRQTAVLTTADLRAAYLIDGLFEPGRLHLTYVHYDRVIVGGAVPGLEPLPLPCPDALKAAYFLERREIGIINIGGAGEIGAGGAVYPMGYQDCLYVGQGVGEVWFRSTDPGRAARFYAVSAPAHRPYATQHMTPTEATPVAMGAAETANQRTLYKYIHPDGIRSCQLVMGLTQLAPGSVWNTMPPHTHDRRMEAYLYFDLPANQRVLHLMGTPDETRTLWVSTEQAVISPPWSVHAGCGTTRYAFIWAMAGENQAFSDMDPVALADLR